MPSQTVHTFTLKHSTDSPSHYKFVDCILIVCILIVCPHFLLLIITVQWLK